MENQLNKGTTYNFTTISPGVLGSTFKQAKLEGILDYNIAKIVDPNIDQKQAQVRTSLPNGTSTNHRNYTYYSFYTQVGDIVVLAAEWILKDSITEDTIDFIDIRIGGVNSSRLPEIRAILGGAGFNIVNEVV